MAGQGRTIYRLLISTSALVLITVVLLAVVWVKLSDTNATLRSNVNAQVENRAANVRAWCGGINQARDYDRAWCGGINQARDYDRAFVRRVTRGTVAYTLGDLPCRTLVAKTLKSAQHR